MNPYDRRYVMDLIRNDFDKAKTSRTIKSIIKLCIRISMPKADIGQMIDDYNSDYSRNTKIEDF